jgi:3-hydroxymyristoyl/3-hydroxydecanoyl-(acyl carrier protein) dehydratase
LVAFGAHGSRTVDDLLRDVTTVSLALPARAKGSEITLVIRADRYALAVAILAAWARDYVPILPPELDRDAITALASAPSTAAVLHDTASGIPLQIAALLAQTGASTSAPLTASAWQGLASRSHGYARTLDRALAPTSWGNDWLAQARALCELMSPEPGARWATSVGTEHPHGIVLGVLIPLLTGGAFLREPLAPRALAAQLAQQQIDVLVSVPAHLPELLAGVAETPAKLKRVVSALEPLAEPLLRKASAVLGAAVSDLSPAAARIPILRCLDNEGACSDVEALDSAPAARLEHFLRTRAGIHDAAVVAVSAAQGPLLCAAVVGEGLDMRALRTVLATEADTRALNIELLALNRIRRDGIGRAQHNELLRQFGLRPDGTAVNLALEWGETTVRENGSNLEQRTRVHVPADYAYFDGHFTGYPILAGAAQLAELVLPCVRRARPELIRLTQMSRLKFTGRIQPGETIDVVLNMRPGTATLDFALKRDETLCSAGTLAFALVGMEAREPNEEVG